MPNKYYLRKFSAAIALFSIVFFVFVFYSKSLHYHINSELV